MRLYQPIFQSLARSFAAVGLLSGVMVVSWLVAALAVARLIDGVLAREAVTAQIPAVVVLAITVVGFLAMYMARATLLNRRRIWLEHGVGEVVVAHELWRGSEPRHLSRSLAAVDAIAHFFGDTAATALCEAPWAIAMVAGLWTLQNDLAAVASAATLFVIAMTFAGIRVDRHSRAFDAATAAHVAGLQMLTSTLPAPGASLDVTRQIASRWEATQRGQIAARYRQAQAQTWRMTGLAVVVLAAAGTLAAVACNVAPDTLSPGGLSAVWLIAMGSIVSLSRLALHTSTIAKARAAHRQLFTLRLPRHRHGTTRRPPIAPPDMRMPIAAGVFAVAATAASLTLTVAYWQLPVVSIVRHTFATANPTPVRSSPVATPARRDLAARIGSKVSAPQGRS